MFTRLRLGWLAIFCFISFSTFAQTSLWEVSKGSNKMFIAGTIHVLAESDYPLPKAFDDAFHASDMVVFETDMKKMESTAFQQTMIETLSYPQGQNLQQVLSPVAYRSLEEYCLEQGVPMQMINQFKPGMVSIILTMMELKSQGYTAAGVDKYFALKAEQVGMPVGELETVKEQLSFLADMGKGSESDFILYTLEDMKELPSFISEMKKLWREGKQADMDTLAVLPMKAEFPQLYKSLLVERNRNWLPKIEGMFKTDAVELIMVGTLHLVGTDGILNQLKEKGYTIKQL